ncbi:hypothetical protein PoB_002490700 [Plakobranchus ocellatus]|uniref:Uncharacterized protein n=1 Tax=Plakobranchus ocellatus TaxID=259542 RepID=A0AAV3ZTE0_9GAST|nr:hypothetical protein PoB_002490700 [Plakobranchus ocellatus]
MTLDRGLILLRLKGFCQETGDQIRNEFEKKTAGMDGCALLQKTQPSMVRSLSLQNKLEKKPGEASWGVDSTVASESALRSAGTLLSRVRAPPPAPWPDGEPESLRSPCCLLAIDKNQTNLLQLQIGQRLREIKEFG